MIVTIFVRRIAVRCVSAAIVGGGDKPPCATRRVRNRIVIVARKCIRYFTFSLFCGGTETFIFILWCPAARTSVVNVALCSCSSLCAYQLFIQVFFRWSTAIFVKPRFLCFRVFRVGYLGGHVPTAIVINVVFIRIVFICAVNLLSSLVTVLGWSHVPSSMTYFFHTLRCAVVGICQVTGLVRSR
ncbi:uncharacterized protein LOC112690588 [Sipha flava]|uniref:Uncharacterized protein LOC112690588 n=1 Tax=Sipha flava TaxID=143950 RepID=A0A8B8GCT6_9HEMI|nr:uncharacterized protein LOC112690588 [Sipha flava]